MKQATTRRRGTRGRRTTLSGVATILGTLMLLGLAPAGAFAAGATGAAGSDIVTAAGQVSEQWAGNGVVGGAVDKPTVIAVGSFAGNQRRCWWHSWRSHRMTSPAPGDREPPTTPCASLPTSSAA